LTDWFFDEAEENSAIQFRCSGDVSMTSHMGRYIKQKHPLFGGISLGVK